MRNTFAGSHTLLSTGGDALISLNNPKLPAEEKAHGCPLQYMDTCRILIGKTRYTKRHKCEHFTVKIGTHGYGGYQRLILRIQNIYRIHRLIRKKM